MRSLASEVFANSSHSALGFLFFLGEYLHKVARGKIDVKRSNLAVHSGANRGIAYFSVDVVCEVDRCCINRKVNDITSRSEGKDSVLKKVYFGIS